jgi:hypothetical protein
VVIDGDGKVFINDEEVVEAYLLEDVPRIHTTVSFTKRDLVQKKRTLEGAKFRLTGMSDYGTYTLKFADSDENGVVSANTAGEFVEITPSEVRSMWTGEEVALIPVMTAASDETGSVSYGNSYGAGMYGVQNPWLPFDGNDSTCLYYANENVTDGWLQYQFNTPQLVTTIKALFGNYLASNNIPATLYVYDINGTEIEKGNVVVTGWNEGSYGEYTFPVNMIVSKFKFVFGYKQNATNIMTYTVQAYTLAT